MQVAQADILRLVNQYGVGVGNIQSVLDDGRAQQQVVISPHECKHPVFQFFGLHLAVRHADFHVGYQPVQDIFYGREFLHFVVQEKYLASPVEFITDDTLDFVLVEQDNLCLDGNPVGRRGIDDGKVPGSQ